MQRILGSFSLALLAATATLAVARDAGAQSASTQKPMPNVLLLVDTSGSMERMPDNSLPSANAGVVAGGLPNACNPGFESNPNRWGMLLQALTGNLQPYFSCSAQSRASGAAGDAFRNEYKIAGVAPYDTDYALPYHRPLTGAASTLSVCAIGPHRLPGAASGTTGVGPGALGYGTPAGQGGDVRDFPDDALISAKFSHMQSQYGANAQLSTPLGTNSCIFDQAKDGQLDAARDYVRFALMTFDNDNDDKIGVNGGTWPPQGAVQTGGALPFLGQWSYRRDLSNPDYNSAFSTNGSSYGLPDACAPPKQLFEVGARHWGAPPWEGRMIEFPPEDASLLDIQRTNEHIQQVLLATRPYGATPIDGMIDDARDYFWYRAGGPKDDDYVKDANCRDQYIILLTDGAPNLNLRPSCQTGTGICPFPQTAAQTASAMWSSTNRRVTTFVIGFSVNGDSAAGGDGFPAGYTAPPLNNCKAWYAGVGGTPTAMATACSSPRPPAGTTAEACCLLNEIAYAGTGGAAAPASSPAVGPFFAESQADIVLAFGKILATITKAVSTRTVPAYTPAVYSNLGFGVGATTAQFVGSFIPNAQKPWSGELLRERSVCDATFRPAPAAPSVAAGDSMSVNLATQSAANRRFVTFIPDKYTGAAPVGSPPSSDVVDSAGTVRPFNPTPADGIAAASGTERGAVDWELRTAPDIRLAMEIDKTTCKRGRAVGTGPTGTTQIPALDQDSGEACTDVVLGFTTAHVGSITRSGTIPGGRIASHNFNIRCASSGTSPSSGHCSINDAVCDVSNPTACNIIPGQICVPDCAPLGAIFRSNPVVNGPPDALLRDSGYRIFQANMKKRKPALFVATTDGILHAFKALEMAPNAHHELWSFIPPAVLPRLASNYPAGNQVLLDGSPVVKETVWERGLSDLDVGGSTTPDAKWHTTLVAGLGQEGGGYYAVNVTDSDCGGDSVTANECIGGGTTPGWQQPAKGSLDDAGGAPLTGTGTVAKRGPHFLWQLTDVKKNSSTDPAKVVRRTRDGQEMVGLFGHQTGTPAITTVLVELPSVGVRQVGVAILPGGIDGPPVPGQSCPFSVPSGSSIADMTPRTTVRKWAPDCAGGANDAVPGRGVTIVRLDNGQILRHFGRTEDAPQKIAATSVFTESPFHSPVNGTPVVYPQTIGAVAQKVFVGDADGMLWRIDLSSTNMNNWKVQLAGDLVANGGAAESQPIQVTPVLSLDPNGALVINAATGDQESIIFKPGERNYVWSLKEDRFTTPQKARVQWVKTLLDGERVTGPMTVFDRTLYFATFAPRVPAPNQCANAGTARLWGLNYHVARDGSNPLGGALPMWCPSGNVGTGGICNAATLQEFEDVAPALAGVVIPGVTLRATQSCSQLGDVEEFGGTGFTSITPSEFHLTFGVPKARSPVAGLPPSAMTGSVQRPLPRIATKVDAWALVVD